MSWGVILNWLVKEGITEKVTFQQTFGGGERRAINTRYKNHWVTKIQRVTLKPTKEVMEYLPWKWWLRGHFRNEQFAQLVQA